MTLTGKNSTPKQSFDNIWEGLAKRFKTVTKDGKKVLCRPNGEYFTPQLFPDPWNAIVIEYNGFDEGDLFYLDDYGSDDDLLKAILEEIEG